YQLRLLSKVKSFLSEADLEKAIHAFISSRIDYCNALYTGLNQSLLNRLIMVQNAVAHLLFNTSKRSHITPVLRCAYLAKLITVYQPARTLRSSGHTSLVIPNYKYKKFGGRPFAVQGPKLWNTLPAHTRCITVLSVFKSQLKTHLFIRAF
ncbi:hypothetical protein C0J50_4251, partial [Silurus asotus]